MAVFDPDHRLVNLFDFGQWLMPSGITPVFGGSRTTEAEYVHEAVFWDVAGTAGAPGIWALGHSGRRQVGVPWCVQAGRNAPVPAGRVP